MHDPTLQELEDEGLLTWEQAEELSCWLGTTSEQNLPEPLYVALFQAWMLATMDEEATVH